MLTLERLVEVLKYDPATGTFVRISGPCAGKVAGTVQKNGYIRIRVDGKLYYGHRLAWLYMTGEWPNDEIDHVDMDRANNSFANLREASGSENKHNRRKYRNNTSGFKGVSWDKHNGRWLAYIGLNYKKRSIGLFKTPEEAAKAYHEAARKLHGDFARVK